MLRKTKIICTLGPATDKEDVLRQLIEEGMNVARFNFSHGPHDEQKGRLDMLRKLRKELKKPVAALLDTKGPEIRMLDFADGKVELNNGQTFTLTTEDILGDKLTAFAPNTTGIPYYKGDKCCSMEILKQLYDVGRLFDNVSSMEITAQAFKRIAEVELSYRNLDNDLKQIYEDIRQTALCIATRGKAGNGNFELLQDGIIRVKSFMYKNKYQIENAIIDGARAAYLATSIEKGNMNIERYSGNIMDIKDMQIQESLTNRLNKLKINLPEAFFYWAKTSQLL